MATNTNDSAARALYTLTNACGTRVTLCSFGARVIAVETRGRDGQFQNIALSVPDNAAYAASGSYAGATVGPVAGRIAKGQLTLAGKTIQLLQNEGDNTLHGGASCLSYLPWQVHCAAPQAVTFTCALPDGLCGFTGNRAVTVCYTLTSADTLTIDYTATTDAPTVLNLTSHIYWNLDADFSADAYGQTLEICADTVLYNDAAHLPTGRVSVQNTPFCFTQPRSVRNAMQSDATHAQLQNAQGYNNAFLLRQGAAYAARLTSAASGRRVTLRTSYPSVVFYSGGYLLPVAGCALALEAQFAPDGSVPVLRAGETYRQSISFQFDIVE